VEQHGGRRREQVEDDTLTAHARWPVAYSTSTIPRHAIPPRKSLRWSAGPPSPQAWATGP